MEEHKTLKLTTPEGVTFTLVLAGPITRFLARAIDVGCVWIITTALAVALGLLSVVSGDIMSAAYLIAYFVISQGYGIFLEWRFQGKTIGKHLLRLRVMDVEGFGLTLNQVVIRNLLRFVDSIPLVYLIGGAASLVSRRAQRLGDIAANTIVVLEEKSKTPDMNQITSPKYNSLRAYPHLIARLRRDTTQSQAALAVEALMRRDELDAFPRVELFAGISAMFKGITPLPEEVTQGITDEQFIRNVVDVLYGNNDRPRRKGPENPADDSPEQA